METGPLQIRGDAQGILQAVVLSRAKQPVVNKTIAEISLILGHDQADFEASHWFSDHKRLADALGRVPEGEAVPIEFAGLPRVQLAQDKWLLLGSLTQL